MAGTIATSGAMMTSPAWATDPSTSEARAGGCRLTANEPRVNGSRLRGTGSRSGCSNTVTYFWVRVYKVIPFWPDSEKAVKGQNYVQNGKLAATGSCDGRGEHYTYTSTASGASGNSVESGRVTLC
jgi:hypothetical protein